MLALGVESVVLNVVLRDVISKVNDAGKRRTWSPSREEKMHAPRNLN